MPTVTIKNQNGGDAGNLEVSADVFEAKQNAVLVREVLNAFMANQRQGTHSTKTRGMVRGGGRKPWKQKHTGRARHGSIRSNIWRGGAVVFGPSPRSYREKVNKKKRQAAFRAVLSAKFAAGEIVVVDGLNLGDQPKTREAVKMLEALGAKGKTLIVTQAKNETLLRGVANLRSSKTNPTMAEVVDCVSIYDLLNCDKLVITKEALASLQERLA